MSSKYPAIYGSLNWNNKGRLQNNILLVCLNKSFKHSKHSSRSSLLSQLLMSSFPGPVKSCLAEEMQRSQGNICNVYHTFFKAFLSVLINHLKISFAN